jgi:hypothetical protein
LKFNLYNRFRLEIIRRDGGWVAYRIGEGLKLPCDNLSIPSDLEASQLITFLDDIYHELARPGASIEELE